MDELTSNLRDAGCGAERIAEIRRLYESGDMRAVVNRLRHCRCALIDELHESQEKIDCLDFLLRKIEKSI